MEKNKSKEEQIYIKPKKQFSWRNEVEKEAKKPLISFLIRLLHWIVFVLLKVFSLSTIAVSEVLCAVLFLLLSISNSEASHLFNVKNNNKNDHFSLSECNTQSLFPNSLSPSHPKLLKQPPEKRRIKWMKTSKRKDGQGEKKICA